MGNLVGFHENSKIQINLTCRGRTGLAMWNNSSGNPSVVHDANMALREVTAFRKGLFELITQIFLTAVSY